MEAYLIGGGVGAILGFIAGTLVAHNNAQNVQHIITAVQTAKTDVQDHVTAVVTAATAPSPDTASKS